MAQQEKAESEMLETTTVASAMQPPISEGAPPLMRSKEDDLSIWQSALRYKRVGLLAMTVSFCAALDGYRKAYSYQARSADVEDDRANRTRQQKSTSIAALSRTKDSSSSSPAMGRRSLRTNMFRRGVEFNLLASSSAKLCVNLLEVIRSKLSLTNIPQLLQYGTERLGRKPALLIIWVILVAVSR
jgi:hypothetical protein